MPGDLLDVILVVLAALFAAAGYREGFIVGVFGCVGFLAGAAAGAVRAMEFDINPEWHTLITYTHGAHGLVPTMVGPNPMQSSDRYLVPDDRDFFAVYRPLPGPVTVPFN